MNMDASIYPGSEAVKHQVPHKQMLWSWEVKEYAALSGVCPGFRSASTSGTGDWPLAKVIMHSPHTAELAAMC